MNMYMMGEYHLFSIVLVVIPNWLWPQFGYAFTAAGFLLMAVYYFFTCRNFFKQDLTNTLFKVVAIELLFMLTFGLLMGLGLIVFMIQSGLHIKDLQ